MQIIPLIVLQFLVVCQSQFRTWDEALTLARDQVSKLTLEEKVALATGLGRGRSFNNPCVGNTAPIPSIPGYNGLCLQDSPTGVRYVNNASAFASSLNVAATFDRDLMLKNGQLLGKEFRGKGVNVALAPMMNILRVPNAGQSWGGQGADPYLASQSARLQVRGIQQQGVIATAKHFIGNEQESFKESSSNIDDRSMHQIYMQPFKACIEEGVGAIMCSYNQLNNTFACENVYAIYHLLKGELGFQGMVMTDWWATQKLESSKVVDLMMPGNINWSNTELLWGNNLVQSVRNHTVQESRVDDMAIRILGAWYKLGQDNDFPKVNFDSFNPQKDQNINVQENHGKHIRHVGAASSVLLKNNGVLPLKYNQKLAVIGADAGPGKSTSNDPSCRDHGCYDGTIATGWGSGTSNFPYIVTPIDGITTRAVKGNSTVQYSLTNDFSQAQILAREADVALVFVSAVSGEGFIVVDGNAGDRNNLTLWNNGNELIEKVSSNNPQTVVIIHGPGAFEMPWLSNVSAVIHAIFPGQESGNSIADILFGDINPSGRLPFTINSDMSKYSAVVMKDPLIPAGYSTQQVNYDEKLLVDYRYNDAKKIDPLFEFGFGLSYTNFEYFNFIQNLNVVNSKTQEKIKFTFQIKNIGDYDGEEVVQLYLGFPESAGEPPKQLKNFDKKMVQKGDTVNFSLDFGLDAMQIWDVVQQKWVNVQGTYIIYIGASSRDIKWQGSLLFEGSE